jgi:CRP/FNR family transcriptional regulator
VYQLCVPLGLDTADMALLERIVRRKQLYRRGEVLFQAGQPFDCVYAIRSGSVKTCLATEDGRVQITGVHVPGELLGLSAIESRHYTCEAIALESTSACMVAVERLQEVAAEVPAIHHHMLRIMSTQIMHDEELMLLLGKRTGEERLAAFLLGLSRRFAKRNFSSTQFNLSMSRGDIGNYLGLAEETVCRLFTRFQEQGLITVRRRHVHLDNPERLLLLVSRPLSAKAATTASSRVTSIWNAVR